MDLQSNQTDCCCELIFTSPFSSHRLLSCSIGSCQLAALKLVEQGKITFDSPVGDYLPDFRNPIVLDSIDTQKPSFKPAETVVTLKHLLTFTSGVFTIRNPDSGRISEGHCSKELHRSKDPTSEFFRIVKVRSLFGGGYFLAGIQIKLFYQGEFPALPLKFEPGTDCKPLPFSSPGDITIKSSPFGE